MSDGDRPRSSRARAGTPGKPARPAPPRRASPPRARPRIVVPRPDRAVVDALDELLGGRRDLRPGRMFGCPGYFAGAKAVAVVFGDELNLTLPPDRIAALVAQPGYRRFEVGGRVMTGWVLVDQDRLAALAPDDPLLDAAIAWARAKATAAPRRAATPRPRRP